jgi:TDG/mug DNA glycosylase family protein
MVRARSGKVVGGDPGPRPLRPSRADLVAAAGRGLPDIIGPGLTILFCGINPGLYSAAVGHHFARPGNRFWPALYAGGFTERLFSPEEGGELLEMGYGLTNIVPRATAGAAELTADELRAGATALARKVRAHEPRWVAILGISAYRTAFARPQAALGRQDERIEGARIWLLPSPSGLNAHHQPRDLAAAFSELRRAVHRSHPERSEEPA